MSISVNIFTIIFCNHRVRVTLYVGSHVYTDMLSLILLSLVGSALSVPVTNDVTRNFESYRLSNESFPTFYDVRLFFDPRNVVNFTGDVSIRLFTHVPTDEIVLHAMAMQIKTVEIHAASNEAENLMRSYTLATDDTHFLRIETTQMLLPLQPYILKIEYVGTYADNMFGVYVSTYQYSGQTVNLITSQLQPTFARRAFPCYDEPLFKAVFRTTIYAPPEYPVVRTNMPERTDLSKPNVDGYVKYEFQDTLVMSSYLLAFLVSNFQYVSNEENQIYNIPFRVYSRPGTQDTAEFALGYGQDNMIALEKYTEFPYAMPKLDKAAVPDFAAGAMENWGLVIYREVALLVQEGVTTTATKQNIGRIICHENVHMWFGNEVSPLSWTYTWLNEGFANFFENYGTDLAIKGWRMMDQYVLLLQNVFQSDAVLSVNPMTHPVYTPSQIISTFNAVAYQKSGSVIRMMQHFLTPEIFRKGLVIYLRNNSRRAVGPADLYAGLQQALDESNHTIDWPISTIMQRWTTQGGFPVLNVRRSAVTAESVFVSQQRFLTDSSLSSPDTWHVPINWVLSTNPDFSETKPQRWLAPTGPALAIDIPGLSDAEWFIFNKQQTGYYRVNYNVENWQALANVLIRSHNTIHLLNRAQIIDDSFNLARNGRLDYRYAFEVSRYLINETDYIAWGAADAAFSYLDVVLAGSEAYQLFQQYVLHLTQPLYAHLGFDIRDDEEHVTPFHRNIILNLNCRYGNQHCVNTAQQMLQELRSNSSYVVKADIQTTVFCSGLRGGSVDNFNFLWERYLASQDSSEQSILLNALGCTSNETLRDFYLNQVIDKNSSVREQDRHSILVSVINASPEGMERALYFVLEHFATIQQNVQGLTGTTNILNAFARRLTTRDHLVRISTFASRYQNYFTAGETASVNAIIENISASIAWTQRNYNVVNNWLNVNYGSNANVLTSGFLIIISIFITLYNY
ncbi:aminopeptidase N-like [Vanessa cardui]|uniref:aminopeptidase N-like n=1 Tax=Vanessa cardui TaxID=171605 RepID=UPI001F137828|nr:aminopeptidase N-like [Vanessa cardui]